MDQEHQYRIVKRASHRNDEGVMQYRYHIEYLGETFFLHRPKWYSYTEEICGWGDCYDQVVEFTSEEKAKEYLENLKQPVKCREIISV